MDEKLKFYYWGAPIEQAVVNFGDLLTPLLMTHYCGDSVAIASSIDDADIFCVGSILGRVDTSKFSIVLGSGFIRKRRTKRLNHAHCYALRGPRSKHILKLQKDVAFGDPGLLMPYIFPKKDVPDTQAPIGIVPHYTHFESAELEPYKNDPRYKVINVMAEPKTVIDEICSCSTIFSSSLHGLIIADAYKIPNVRLIFDKPLFGRDFKFNDYFDAVGRKGEASKTIKLEQIEETYKSGIDTDYFTEVQKAQENLDTAFRKFTSDIPMLTELRARSREKTTLLSKLSRMWQLTRK
ncbi:MAG: polysaccharide pyruvyl transferase family protein [Akkermansia sp.]|nr:polysaccharide pyruvyl transferase family protein [Akkermansia sp.]